MDWELASYVVTVVGLPLAIFTFVLEQRKQRENEEDEIYQLLSDEYSGFCRTLIQNADLQLMSTKVPLQQMTAEQRERKLVIFEMLISLFERAFLLVYSDTMTDHQKRLWASWVDYIDFWCQREDFVSQMPQLLQGEDPDFSAYLKGRLSAVKNEKASAVSG